MAKPRKGEILELTITTLAFGGAGIGRSDDFVVFVPGAVPGDVAEVQVTKVKRQYAQALLLGLKVPSPERRGPQCSHFSACGGCSWQSLDYAAQLRYKTQQVRDSLERLAGQRDFELRPILAMTDPWRYRNRVDFSIAEAGGRPSIGFHAPGHWDEVLAVSECHLLPIALEQTRTEVELWLRAHGIEAWHPRLHTGYARHLLVRGACLSSEKSEVLVSLVTSPAPLPHSADLVDRLRATRPELVGVIHAVNPNPAEVTTGLSYQTLWGRPFLLEKIAGVALKVSVDAFLQTNTRMADLLYATVLREAELDPIASKTVWDLYSGVGSIGLALASKARRVLGIETVPAAVEDARENARLNGINNAVFLEGDVAKVLRDAAGGQTLLPPDTEHPDVIVVDPPRAGLGRRAAAMIATAGAPRIVYVSCNPASLAGDLTEILPHGYVLVRVTPVDMFPHTPHIEAVAVLKRIPG
jgi:23S rRNA (uracil1939-C5)-methyltransferase